MSTSDTPRTDKAENAGCWANDSDLYVEAEFARQLERELSTKCEQLAAAQARVAEVEKDMQMFNWLMANACMVQIRSMFAGRETYTYIGCNRRAIAEEMAYQAQPAPNTLPHA